jgi:hypothetical protein
MNAHADFGLDHGLAPRRCALDPQVVNGCIKELVVH